MRPSNFVQVLAVALVVVAEPVWADSAVASFPLIAAADPVEAPDPGPPPSEPTPVSARDAAESPPAPGWTYLRPIDTRQRRVDRADPDQLPAARERDDWMLSIEGVTHAPVDVGIQLGVETSGGLRLCGGYGFMPAAYLDPLTDVAALASGDTTTSAVLREGSFSGRTWRAQVGLRPFENSGAYIDAGYAHLVIDGQANAPEGAPAGSYVLSTTLHMWLVELGYQAKIADRVVLALALGAMGTLDAHTQVSQPVATAQPSIDQETAELDQKLEDYGIIPTLALRLGFDLI